jgi:hypothetical protein
VFFKQDRFGKVLPKKDRAEEFMEALPEPGTAKAFFPPAPRSDKFLKKFSQLYQRTPAAYKNRPPDLASELVQTRLLLDELRSLLGPLKPS